jgi:hypothetical protein
MASNVYINVEKNAGKHLCEDRKGSITDSGWCPIAPLNLQVLAPGIYSTTAILLSLVPPPWDTAPVRVEECSTVTTVSSTTVFTNENYLYNWQYTWPICEFRQMMFRTAA